MSAPRWTDVPLFALAGAFALLAVSEGFALYLGVFWMDLPLDHWVLRLWGLRTLGYAITAWWLVQRDPAGMAVGTVLAAFGIWLYANDAAAVGPQSIRIPILKTAAVVLPVYLLATGWRAWRERRSS